MPVLGGKIMRSGRYQRKIGNVYDLFPFGTGLVSFEGRGVFIEFRDPAGMGAGA